MATYNFPAVSDAVIAFKKAVTIQILRALRDNLIASFEGAVGAPRLQLAALDDGFTTAGGLGSYVFAYHTGGDVAFGATVAGSTLLPTSAARSVSSSGSASVGAGFSSGTALSGTWRCMGHFDQTVTASGDPSGHITLGGAALWIRIV